MNKKIIIRTLSHIAFLFVGVTAGYFLSFDKIYSNIYTADFDKEFSREKTAGSSIENELDIPIMYNIRETAKILIKNSNGPEIFPITQFSPKGTATIVDVPEGQTAQNFYPFSYDGDGPAGYEYIYIDINDPKKLSSVPEMYVSDDTKNFDASVPVETYTVAGHTIKEQGRLDYMKRPLFGEAGLCRVLLYLIDVTDENNFPVVRLRYSHDMCKPELEKTWSELRGNLINPENWK